MDVLRALARFTHRRRWVVLGVFLALLAGAIAYAVGAEKVLSTGGFTDPRSESVRAARILEHTFGVGQPDVIVVYSHPRLTLDDPAFELPLRRALGRLAEQPGVESSTSPFGPEGAAAVSDDRRDVMVSLELAGDDNAARDALFERIEPLLRVEGLTSRVGGAVPLEREAQALAERDLRRGELITIPVLAILLVVIFRGVIAASLPLMVGGFAIAGALSCVRLLAHVTDVATLAINLVTFIGLGVAVDYALLMTSRFREELASGQSVAGAVERTMTTAGRTIAYSGVVVTVSLLGMLAFPVVLLRSVAIAGALVVALAVLATLVALPAGLAALGHRIEWARVGRPRAVTHDGRIWRRLAGISMRAPTLTTVLTSALLLLLGLPFLRLNAVVGGPGILPAHTETRVVAEILESGRFPATRHSTNAVVLTTDAPILTSDGLRMVERYALAVGTLPGVERVDAIAGGDASLSSLDLLAMRDQLPPPVDAVVRGDRTIVRVIGSAPPGSKAAMDLVERVREVRVPGVEALVGGQTAHNVDLDATIKRGLPWAVGAICLVTFIVLFLAFGSFVVPIKAIVMNVLSLTASFGALVWIFQDGRLEGLLRYESSGAIELTVPVAMFALMFGLAMDYELFLLSRIREGYDRSGDTRASVAFGVEQTATIITRAALLLIAVMLGFISADMVLIKQLGVGMAIAIAVDVTIVRGLLVPATMQLLGRYNWWAPRSLASWWRRAVVGVDESARPPAHGPA